MPRQGASSRPTEFELQILQILWQLGPSALGEIHHVVTERREVTYSTTRKMLQVMRDKGLIVSDESVRPQTYRAASSQGQTQLQLADDLVRRAFEGSTQKLVMSLLSADRLSSEELAELKLLLRHAQGSET